MAVAGALVLNRLPNIGLKLKEAFNPEGLAEQRRDLLTAIDNKEGNLLDHANKALELGVISQSTFTKAVNVESIQNSEAKDVARATITEIIEESCNNLLDDYRYSPSM